MPPATGQRCDLRPPDRIGVNNRNLSPAVWLMGPTATGKTALALALAERLPIEIVNVDSSQVYRGLDIGTAKPTLAERARVPHRLIDIRDPVERYSAADFRVDALREMQTIARAGRVPMLVGGTMFYFYALDHGLAAVPGAAPEIRARLAVEAARSGWPALHARLSAADPATAARIEPHDAQRITRALELLELTGQPGAAATRPRIELPFRVARIALWPRDRTALHERIARRFDAMLERGLVPEVEELYRRGDLNPELPSMRTVGYRQVWHYLTGASGYIQMRERAIVATRQVAKRQMTWLRRYPEVERFETDDDPPYDAVLERVLRHFGERDGTR